MRKILISDTTMKKSKKGTDFSLSFREKIELCKLLDRLGVDSIETGVIENRKIDGLLIKSISSAVEHAAITVPVPATEEGGIEYTWNCLKTAKKPRLQVALPVSTVQMEYIYHMKQNAMLDLIGKSVAECRKFCSDVEFSAEDAGRSDKEFLIKVIKCAAENGAGTITICDTAGNMLPQEIFDAVSALKTQLPEGVRLGVCISNDIYMANSSTLYAVKAGADEVKVTAYGSEIASLEKLATVIKARGDDLGVACGIRYTELHRGVGQIEWLCKTNRSKASPFDSGVRDEGDDFSLNIHDDISAVKKAAEKLGYDLSDEDTAKVYEAFLTIAGKKDRVSAKELDLLIAASALQVPPTYVLDSYVINSGNIITATSHIKLTKNGAAEEGICVGDGPIDASFLAIEQITGSHYELDDFQIRSVTEGREAMGEAVVRLRSNGKLYSGRGISTDIVGSSIMAYLSALNKIVYEESEV